MLLGQYGCAGTVTVSILFYILLYVLLILKKIIGDGLYCSTGCKLIFCGELGHNITIGANCVVSKEFKTNGVLLTSIPCAIKAERVGWYKYAKRVFSVENLKIQMKNRNKTFLID